MNNIFMFHKYKTIFKVNIKNLSKNVNNKLENNFYFFNKKFNTKVDNIERSNIFHKLIHKKKFSYSFVILMGSIGCYGFYQWNEQKKNKEFLKGMQEISDTIFDNIDNIVLFVLDKKNINKQKNEIIDVIDEIKNIGLKNLNFLYTYNEDSQDFFCILYKGRRRQTITKNEILKTPIKDIFIPFFTPVSEDFEKLNKEKEKFPTFVTHNTFEKEIVEDSMKNKILLVLFENSCFLCFLYKPFLNSLNKLFKEYNIQLQIKKYNIEKNDYAPNMIISRGTPTFLLYDNGKGIKFSEYKPSEIIKKIDEIIKFPEQIKKKIIDMSEKIHERMHHFGLLTLWMTESRVIESMLLKRHIKENVKDLDDENLYNEVLTSLMEEDMSRNDFIEESLEYTKERIKEAEKNCFITLMMMGQEIIDEETKKTAT